MKKAKEKRERKKLRKAEVSKGRHSLEQQGFCLLVQGWYGYMPAGRACTSIE